jgi:virulence factor Mce-like protein
MAALSKSRPVVIGALAAAALVVLLILISGGGGSGHKFSAVVPSAANVVTGQKINAGGRNIGAVSDVEPVDRGRAARITMRIDDGDYWPIARDSKVEVRLGGTASFGMQYLLLTRGKDTAQTVPEGGQLASGNVKVPVEVDDFLSLFDTRLRGDLKQLVNTSSQALDQAGPSLHRALGRTTPVVQGASGVLGDLTRNEQALDGLVRSTGSVVDAVDRSSPGVRTLLDGAAQTFDAIAAQADDLETTLERLPRALRQTRTTLTRADVTLRDTADLTDKLAPGVTELRRTATPLRTVLAGLRKVTPTALAALRIHRKLHPVGDFLYRLGRNTSPVLQATAEKATKEIGCLRPYTPEIVLLATTWGDWMSGVDEKDHTARANVQNYMPAAFNSVPYTPEQAARLFPGLTYGFPRPPGALANQPWFQPQCGVGPDVVDPSKDQEAKNFREADLPPEQRAGARAKRNGGGR